MSHESAGPMLNAPAWGFPLWYPWLYLDWSARGSDLERAGLMC
jgi:hypothetical protein